MATATVGSETVRAVIIDGPQAGQIVTLDDKEELGSPPDGLQAAMEAAERLEQRADRMTAQIRATTAELRQINRSLGEKDGIQ